jgi:predicted transcriptional regulator
MVRHVLMSIHPQYAEAIVLGHKRYEIRRARPQFPAGTIVWLYATKPRGAIVGWFESGQVIDGPPQTLWRSLKNELGIDSKAFKAYVSGCERVFAIEIRWARPAPSDLPMPRGLLPPQSYRYLPAETNLPLFQKSNKPPDGSLKIKSPHPAWLKMQAMGSS